MIHTPATVTIDDVEYTAEPASIVSTFLGREDHGIPTFSFTVEGAGWGIGMPGYRLGEDSAALLVRILDVVGAPSWEKMTGRPIHALIRDQLLAGIIDPLRGEHVVFKTFIADRKN